MNCRFYDGRVTIEEDFSIINNKLVYGEGDQPFGLILQNALVNHRPREVAFSHLSDRVQLEELNAICNILTDNSNNISTLIFLFSKGRPLQHLLRRLTNNVSCRTLVIKQCSGFNWQDDVAEFIRQTERLQTVRFKEIQITHERLRNAIIASSSLVELEFTLDNSDSHTLGALSILISNGHLRTLRVSGSHIRLSSIRNIKDSLKNNTALETFQLRDISEPTSWLGRPYYNTPVTVQLSDYLDILGYKEIASTNHTLKNINSSFTEIVSSNHTLKNINSSLMIHPNAESLMKCLEINRLNISTKSKIKKKILLNSEALERFVVSISTINKKDNKGKKDDEGRRKMQSGWLFIYWLGQHNIDEEMEILSLRLLFKYLSLCDVIREAIGGEYVSPLSNTTSM